MRGESAPRIRSKERGAFGMNTRAFTTSHDAAV